MNISKFLYIIGIMTVFGFARPEDTNIRVNPKSLFSVEKRIQDVQTVGEAKSSETKCSVRADTQRMLLKVGPCDIERVSFFSKDSTWLGYVQHDILNTENSFSANNEYSGVYFNFNIRDAAYMTVDFAYSTDYANSSNLSKVTCPAGMSKGIKDSQATCYIPWQCKRDEYSTDEQNCEKMPQNAHRLKREGYECNDGFLRIERYNNVYCELKVSCKTPNLFNKELNECYPLPKNATWTMGATSATDYKCKSGFYNDGTGCSPIPANAHINLYENGWECNHGYKDDRGVCRKLVHCNDRQIQTSDFSCEDLPKNSHFTYGDNWECDFGYTFIDNNRCERIPTCSEKEVLNTQKNICEKIPKHAKKYDDETWDCNVNYHVEYDKDKPYCKHDPRNFHSKFSFEIAALGGMRLGDIPSEEEDEYGYEEEEEDMPITGQFEAGIEWLFGESFRFGPTATLVQIIEYRPYDGTFFDSRLNFGVFLGFRAKTSVSNTNSYYYIKPFLSVSLYSTADQYDYEYWGYTTSIITGGAEFGIRVGLNEVSSDLFLSIAGSSFSSPWISNSPTLFFGMRFIFL